MVLSTSIDVEPIKRNEVWARDVISPMGAIREISWSNVGAGGATERERELPSLLMTVNKIPSATNVLSATMLPFQKKMFQKLLGKRLNVHKECVYQKFVSEHGSK